MTICVFAVAASVRYVATVVISPVKQATAPGHALCSGFQDSIHIIRKPCSTRVGTPEFQYL